MRATIERLLWYKRASDIATADFSVLQHNRDLCPLLQRKIEDILQRYELHESLVYDIQGRRDEGTDVIVRVGESPEQSYLCFQVKADYELAEKDLLKTLRSQLVQTQNAYHPLEHYYILLFADEIRRRDQLRDVRQAFVRQPGVSVVSPAFLHTFVHLPDVKVDAYIKSLIGTDDIVYRQATEELSGLSPTQAAVIVFLLVGRFFSAVPGSTVSELTSSLLLQDWYSLVPDYRSSEFADHPARSSMMRNSSTTIWKLSRSRTKTQRAITAVRLTLSATSDQEIQSTGKGRCSRDWLKI